MSLLVARVLGGKGGGLRSAATAGTEGTAAAAGTQVVSDAAAQFGHGGEAPSLDKTAAAAAAFGAAFGVALRGAHDFSG